MRFCYLSNKIILVFVDKFEYEEENGTSYKNVSRGQLECFNIYFCNLCIICCCSNIQF